jgi:purine-binding chemotaxis protein CheW
MLMAQEQRPDVVQANLVVFLLNRIHYAIGIEPIQQIIEMVTITPVLKTEAWMEGVINYHGASIPIINLRRHFGMQVVPYRWHTPIILANITGRLVGLIVDDVLDVLTVPAAQITNPHMILPGGIPETPLLKGIIQTEQNITLLLDLEHLFDQVQVRALSAATNALGEQSLPSATVTLKAAKKKQDAGAKGKPRKTEDVPTTTPTNEDAA